MCDLFGMAIDVSCVILDTLLLLTQGQGFSLFLVHHFYLLLHTLIKMIGPLLVLQFVFGRFQFPSLFLCIQFCMQHLIKFEI